MIIQKQIHCQKIRIQLDENIIISLYRLSEIFWYIILYYTYHPSYAYSLIFQDSKLDKTFLTQNGRICGIIYQLFTLIDEANNCFILHDVFNGIRFFAKRAITVSSILNSLHAG